MRQPCKTIIYETYGLGGNLAAKEDTPQIQYDFNLYLPDIQFVITFTVQCIANGLEKYSIKFLQKL